MANIKLKYQEFRDAYNALQEMITMEEVIRKEMIEKLPNVDNCLSAALISHFAITYETCWKFLKEFLEGVHGVDRASPTAVFRECQRYGFLPQPLVDELVNLIIVRNIAIHMYSKAKTRAIVTMILQHRNTLGEVLRLMPSFDE